MRLRPLIPLAALASAALVTGLVQAGAARTPEPPAGPALSAAGAADVVRAVAVPLPVRKAPAARRTAVRAAAPVVEASVPLPVVAPPAETPAVRGARVLASLSYPWQALGYQVEFLPARDGLLGLTIPSRHLVQVFVSASESDVVLAHSIAHELGHVVDFTRATRDRRADYLRVRGLAPQRWFGCAECSDFATAAGDWAEVFAAWLAGPGDFRSELGPAPTAAQLRALTPLFS